MGARRVSLVPDRMTEAQLWARVDRCLARCYFIHGLTPRERDDLLHEAQACLRELRMRGVQLPLLTA
jgi:hypothetical protein